MIKDPLILTFDCGTQSFRALLVDKDGAIVAKKQHYFEPYYSTKPGWAEQKPEVYVEALEIISHGIYQDYPKLCEKIIAVTITTFRDTGVCLGKDGKPIRDIITWLDQRQATCDKKLPLLSRLAFSIAGMNEAIIDQRKITKSNWIIEHEPEIWAKTDKYVLFSTYVTSLLIGKIIDSSANQVGHVPFDFKKKQWFKKNHIKYPIFDVPPEKLPPLMEPGEILGTISKEASQQFGIKEGLPLIASGSDKGCETLGTGVIKSDMASLSFGTTATIQTTLKKYVEPARFMPAYPGLLPNSYNPEIQIFRGYWMISWFKSEFASKEVLEAPSLGISSEQLLNKRLHEIPAGSNGLILQPYWAPLLKNPEAKGAIIGFTGHHTRVHLYKAIIEGIGFALIEGMNQLEKRSHHKITSLTVSGGGSQSDEICQITADMFGKPVHKIHTYEACGLGSSIVAFVSMGVYQTYEQAIEKMVHYKKTFYPDPDTHIIYKQLFKKVYSKIYKSLKPLYKNLRALEKYHLEPPIL